VDPGSVLYCKLSQCDFGDTSVEDTKLARADIVGLYYLKLSGARRSRTDMKNVNVSNTMLKNEKLLDRSDGGYR
jgi:uncharacterized protein YjbI with pentapeptide repeats